MTEREIQNQIWAALNGRTDCRVWRQNAGTFLSEDATRHVKGAPKGTADLGGILSVGGIGYALQVEVKSDTGRQTKEQQAFQRVIESLGGVYMIARSAPDAIRQVEYWSARLGRRPQ